MNSDYKNFTFTITIPPYLQAIFAFVGMLIFCIIGHFFNFSEKMLQQFPWVLAGAFLLVFAIFNSILWISSQDVPRYLSHSIIAYISLAIGAACLAFVISGVPPQEAGSTKVIFIILTIGYLVFLSISGMIKRLFTFLNAEHKQKLSGKNKNKNKQI